MHDAYIQTMLANTPSFGIPNFNFTIPPIITPPPPTGANTSGSASTNTGANSSESLPFGAYVPMNQERSAMLCKGVWTYYVEGAKYIADVMNNRIQASTGGKYLKIAGQVQENVAGNIYTNFAIRLDKNNDNNIWEITTGVYNAAAFGARRFVWQNNVGEITSYKSAYKDYLDWSGSWGAGQNASILSNSEALLAATKWLALLLASEEWQRPYGTCDENQFGIDNGTTTDNQFNNELIDSLKEQQAFIAAERARIAAEQAQAKLIEETRAAAFKIQQENDRIQEEIRARQRGVDAETARQEAIIFAQNQEAERLRFAAEQALLNDKANAELANRLAREAAEREAAERERLRQAGNTSLINSDKVGVKLGTQIYDKPADWTKKTEPNTSIKPSTGTKTGGREEGDGTNPDDKESFWGKYKWWVIGGIATVVVVGGGATAYAMKKKPKVTDKKTEKPKKDKK